jgi:HK97 family phage major capsid protein
MTQKETFAHKGGPEAMASRVLEQIDERLNEKVREGLITVDEAMTEIKKVRAEFDDWREKVDAEQRKLQMPGSSEGYSLGRVAQACMAGGSQSHYEKHAPHEWSVSSVALSLGAQEMNFTSTPVEIPREAGSVLAPTSKGENATLDSQDVEFGQLRMNPRLTGLIVKGSRRFFAMGEAADPFISNILAREMRIKIDTYALKGTGAQDQPIGILNASGVNSVDFGVSPAAANNDYLVYEHLVEMSALPLENGNHETMSRPGWAIAAKAHRAFQTIKSEGPTTSDHGEVARKVLTDSKIDRLLGDPFRATTLLTSGADTELIFGDWQQCVVGFWGGMQIESTEVGGTAFESHQRWLKATVEMDVGIWHPDAFSVSTNYDVTGI